MWLDSYKNHIFHSAIYVAVAASTATSSLPIESFGDVLRLVLCGLAILSLFYEVYYVVNRWGLPPGDSGTPILGHLPQMLHMGPLRLRLNFLEKYGDLYTYNLLMQPILVATTEEDVKWCLSQERKGNLVPFLMPHARKLLGEDAIMLQHSANHKRLRRIFEPSFSPSSVKGYTKILDDTVQTELEKWSATEDYCESKEWAKLAMRLFFVCAFGGKVDEKLLNTLNSLFHTWVSGFMSPLPVAFPGTSLANAFVAKKKLGDVLQKLIDDFKTENPPDSPAAQDSMMGRLCYGVDDDGKPLSNNQLINNIQFILFAGHDTTKGSFGAIAHFLVQYPKIRTLLMEEVEAFKDPLDPDELKAAPLLNAFLAETWRLVAPLDGHNTIAATNLEYKGYKIGKGVGVSMDIQCANASLFKNPDEFRLERWLPEGHPMYDATYFEKGVDYNVMSSKYRAFNMGSHMCLGGHFAKLEARIVLTRLLQNYMIEIRHDKLIEFPLRQYSNEFKLKKRIK